MQTIPERLSALREAMAARGMEAYIIPASDFHASEYVGVYFEVREYFSGFTGSAGTLMVTKDAAALWTDGRYFLQAEEELTGSTIDLMRMDEPGVPTMVEYLKTVLQKGGGLGMDARTISAFDAKAYLAALPNVKLMGGEDVAGNLWEQRPKLSGAPVYELPVEFAGEGRETKLHRLRTAMEQEGADAHLIASLDDIAWLFNFRGADVKFNPVALCFALIEPGRATLYIQREKLPEKLLAGLRRVNANLRPYAEIYPRMAEFTKEARVLLDPKTVNYALVEAFPGVVIEKENPTTRMKNRKNPVEQENLRRAHRKDGAALCRLLYWLKTHPNVAMLTEVAVAKRMDDLRLEQEGCIGPSFATIAGYGPHGAIVHYHPTPKKDCHLKREGFLLLDSGGQYYEGTTDVTRTIALGGLSAEQKEHFSLVLKGMLNLSNARFPRGGSGGHLDAIARMPLWERGLDYRHGTGHGIGYLLCVHEGPVNIRWRSTDTPLAPGMVVSDEPGLYVEGSHGIRIENQLLVQHARETQYGEFLEFETLTLAPIDRDAIDKDVLEEAGVQQLNAYHQRVYREIGPLLPEAEQAWLYEATRPL